LDRFDVLMSKIIFKKLKKIIDMHFSTKSTRNHTVKHAFLITMLLTSSCNGRRKKRKKERLARLLSEQKGQVSRVFSIQVLVFNGLWFSCV
jgi:hypothetical protein